MSSLALKQIDWESLDHRRPDTKLMNLEADTSAYFNEVTAFLQAFYEGY